MIDAAVFDLDDTLYDQLEYLRGAFRSVAQYLSLRTAYDEDKLLSMLLEVSEKKGSGSGRIINEVVQSLGLKEAEGELVSGAIDAFSSFRPTELHLLPEARQVIDALSRKRLKLGLLTDGTPSVQWAKIRALSLSSCFDAAVVTDEFGRERRKPDPFGYTEIMRRLGVESDECVFIGDNPKKDFIGARKLGIRTVRVLTGEYRSLSLGGEFEADHRIHDLSELPALLARLERLDSEGRAPPGGTGRAVGKPNPRERGAA